MSHTNYGELWLHSDVQYNMILPHSHKMATAVLVLMQGRSEKKKKQSLNLSEIKKCLPRAPSRVFLGPFCKKCVMWPNLLAKDVGKVIISLNAWCNAAPSSKNYTLAFH